MDYNLPSSSIHGIFQVRILVWVAISFSRGSSQHRDQTQVSCIAGGFFTSWTIREAQEYWSGYPIPSPEDLPDPGIELRTPTLQADSLPAEPQEKPKNTRVGSLSLLQRIFLTQEWNQGFLHCRQTLYQLSYVDIHLISLLSLATLPLFMVAVPKPRVSLVHSIS